MDNLIEFEIREKYISKVYLKVESNSVFQDNYFLETLNNPEYPIAFEENFILLQLEIWMGAVGVQGSVSLILPPVDFDITDCWDFCRKAGVWDIWSFLSFQYQYNENLDPIIFFNFNKGNFFEVDLDVYKIIELQDLYENSDDFDVVSDILSSDPQHLEFPEDVDKDFDYKKYYIELVNKNFVDMLRLIWSFEIIQNPIEQN